MHLQLFLRGEPPRSSSFLPLPVLLPPVSPPLFLSQPIVGQIHGGLGKLLGRKLIQYRYIASMRNAPHREPADFRELILNLDPLGLPEVCN